MFTYTFLSESSIYSYILDKNAHLPTQTNGVSDPFKL